MKKQVIITTTAATLAGIALFSSAAHADEFENSVKFGYAGIKFNIQSGDLTGPPGTTPPGIGIDLKNLIIPAISYERRLSREWSVQFQGGGVPTMTALGTGNAQSVGEVAHARMWYPTVLALYTFNDVPVIRPYVGLGATYIFFTGEKSTAAYNAAVGGTSSSVSMKSILTPYIRVGFEYPIDKLWSIHFDYGRFKLKTTATVATQTPGIGEITRRVDIKDTPQIFGLTLGYKF